jgi:hypothetical protein
VGADESTQCDVVKGGGNHCDRKHAALTASSDGHRQLHAALGDWQGSEQLESSWLPEWLDGFKWVLRHAGKAWEAPVCADRPVRYLCAHTD